MFPLHSSICAMLWINESATSAPADVSDSVTSGVFNNVRSGPTPHAHHEGLAKIARMANNPTIALSSANHRYLRSTDVPRFIKSVALSCTGEG